VTNAQLEKVHNKTTIERYFARVDFMKLVQQQLLLLAMLAAASRAFLPAARPFLGISKPHYICRMSGNSAADSTTIVDICQKKIQEALSATSVKVTGM
jgi:hypothetical protein